MGPLMSLSEETKVFFAGNVALQQVLADHSLLPSESVKNGPQV